MLLCTIESIELLSPGLTALVPGLSPFPDWIREREWGLHPRVVPIADGAVMLDGRALPCRPMVGVMGCAPLLESVSTVDNGPHGGNLDVQEFNPGTTVYLPVFVDGALFALGDCHALQGDGELCGCGGIECRTYTTVTLDAEARATQIVNPKFTYLIKIEKQWLAAR